MNSDFRSSSVESAPSSPGTPITQPAVCRGMEGCRPTAPPAPGGLRVTSVDKRRRRSSWRCYCRSVSSVEKYDGNVSHGFERLSLVR